MGDSRPNGEMDSSVAEVLPEKEILLRTKDDEIQVVLTPESGPVPHDRFNLVYFILLLHGVGILMPWNMFINANGYFVNYKLNASSDNSTDAESTSIYRDYFLSCLGFVSQIPNVMFNAVNLFCQFKSGPPAFRIVFSIIMIAIMFIITIVLAMLDSSAWVGEFFWVTMISVVIINVFTGFYQNSIYGTAANLPPRYTGVIILGSNTSGLVTSIIAIIAAAVTPDPRSSAIYYFLTAIFILLVAFDTYFALPMLPFYKHHVEMASKDKDVSDESDNESFMTKYLIVIKKCWVHMLSVFFVFFVTLTCFPAIEAGIERVDSNFIISEKFFSLVSCFLFFNLFAVVGSLLTQFVTQPGPKYVWIPVLLRVLFIPFFMFCNFRPSRRKMPLLFDNDYVYCAGSILMSLTSGYFSSLTMMYAPRNVEDKYKGIAGMMAAFCLISGVFVGIIFSVPMIYAIENFGSFILPTAEETHLGFTSNESAYGVATPGLSTSL